MPLNSSLIYPNSLTTLCPGRPHIPFPFPPPVIHPPPYPHPPSAPNASYLSCPLAVHPPLHTSIPQPSLFPCTLPLFHPTASRTCFYNSFIYLASIAGFNFIPPQLILAVLSLCTSFSSLLPFPQMEKPWCFASSLEIWLRNWGGLRVGEYKGGAGW